MSSLPPTIPLHRSPAAGFEQPFEMLQACHERVERMLRLMQRLRVHLLTQGHDEPVRQAAGDVMRYFDTAAPAHHEDEERHVFPALLAADLHRETITRLQQEHLEMTALWPQVRALLQRVADGPWSPFSPDDEGVLERYARLYDWHIAAENELVYPAAQQHLDAAAQATMGQEMSRRRGIVGLP